MSRIAAVVFSYCPADPRVRRESEALAEAGMETDIICLRGAEQAWFEQDGAIRFYRLPITRKRGGKLRYLWEYVAFTMLAAIVLAGLHLRRWYGIVHVHNMPDVLVFSALVPRLFGARVILDLHDPMPEVFMTKYAMGEDHKAIRLLRLLERWSIAFASVVVTPNIGFRDLFIARGCPEQKIHVVMNSPQESVFGETGNAMVGAGGARREERPFTIMFHGTVVERHGLGTALEALAMLRARAPDIRFEVYGDGDFVETFEELVEHHGLSDMVRYHGFVPLERIAEAIPDIDLGLVPNMRSVFTEINMPTRLFEYLCKGKPVIAPRTKGILDYFGEDDIFFFEPGDAASLAATIEQARSDAELRDRVLARGMSIYQQHSWRNQRRAWLDIVARLLGKAPLQAMAKNPAQKPYELQ